jgi:hypothetical protein
VRNRAPALAAVAANVNQLFDFILTSPLIDRLAEYSSADRS